ncbi:MAG: tetraacyldisaccharide 4'-kinase [Phycisphaerae bacterium]|nr:tetraacyldisaccharide 4'-kinase [Phycisphaerae bacterium]
MAINQDQFRAIISGRRRDARASVARSLLGAASLGYRLAVYIRNALYDHRLLRTHRVNAAVLSVGNLTTGGTGKTPLVVWLCQDLREKQVRCAILTRGYKMREGELSDEPALLSALCPGTAVVVNPDRVAGAAEAICRFEGASLSNRGQDARDTQGRDALATRVLVMDDGFQHRRLARDLDIVAIDATRPFGYRRLLPAGLLREPVTGLRRAHAVVLTRCDQVSQKVLEEIEEEIRRVNPDLVLARSIHVPVGVKTGGGTEISLDWLGGKRLFAFCGIGNPQSFFHTVERLGGVLVGSRVYDDHYRYAAGDLDEIRREAAAKEASLILTTQKDWTKISRLAGSQDHPPVAYLAVELRISAGAQALTALIDRVLGSTMPTAG